MTDKTIIDEFEQVDPVLCEDGATVMFYAWTDSPDRTFTATVTLPKAITHSEFLVDEWRNVPPDTLNWFPAW